MNRGPRRAGWIRGAVGLAVFLLIGALVVLYVPPAQLEDLPPGVSAGERAALENEYRRTWVQAIGGAALFLTVYFTARRVAAAELEVRVSEESQITERFARAAELLGSDQYTTRLGAIYALERIAADSERDHWPVMETLSALVREKAKLSGRRAKETPPEEYNQLADGGRYEPRTLPTDVRAALSVLGRRDTAVENGNRKLDLSGCDLRGSDLRGGRFDSTNFAGSDLSYSVLDNLSARNASFFETRLDRASLYDAQLQKTNWGKVVARGDVLFDGADLSNAMLGGCDLRNAHFDAAILVGTHFEECNLTNVDLTEATLKGSEFERCVLDKLFDLSDLHLYDGVSFFGSTLDGADMTTADLSKALGLRKEQIAAAKTSKHTKLPADLPERLPSDKFADPTAWDRSDPFTSR